MWQSVLEFDRELLLALNGSWGPFWDAFFYYVSDKLIWVPLYLAAAYFMWRKVGTRNFLLALACLVVAVAVADQVCNFFKANTPKFRPSHNPLIKDMVHTVRGYAGGLYGTVSGHAALSFTFAVFTARFFRKTWYSIAIIFWAALVAFSRIYLGVHFPLDIFFGTTLGVTLGFLSYYVYRKISAVKPETKYTADIG